MLVGVAERHRWKGVDVPNFSSGLGQTAQFWCAKLP